MKPNTYHFVTTILLSILLCFSANAQQNYPISLQVQVTPPYSAYFSDYRNKPIISFTNHSQQPQDIYLRGRLENDRGQYVQTKQDEYTHIPIHIPGLQTTVLQGFQLDNSYLSQQNLETNLTDQEYQQLIRLGLIPEGMYSFCIYAYIRNDVGTYIPVSDPDAAGSCFHFNINYVAPPIILNPHQNENVLTSPLQNIQINWTVPVGNILNGQIMYDLYMAEVPPGEDPAQVMNNVVQLEAGIFFEQTNIQINHFQFTKLTGFTLEEGHQYALMVQARDVTGKTAFENNGMSEVVSFRYGFNPDDVTDISEQIPFTGQGECNCSIQVDKLDHSNHNASLHPGGSFTMASLTVHIGSLSENNQSVSGEGTIEMKQVPIQVSFSDVVVNKDGIAIAGHVTGKYTDGFNFLHNGGDPQVTTSDYQNFINRLRDYNLEAIRNGAGLTLPFGLNTIGAPDAVNAGIVAINVTPGQAVYDAIAAIRLADANNVLSLLAKDVCFNSSSIMCGNAVFLLNEDFEVPNIHLQFKGYQSLMEPGTYVFYAQNKLKKFHIKAAYEFPTTLLTSTNGQPEVAILDADALSWSDWIASISMEPFKIPSLDGVTFTLKPGAYYDHSTLHNPDGMPVVFDDPELITKNAAIGTPLWTGFFMSSLSVSLPALIKNQSRPDKDIVIAATNLIFDNEGLTGAIGANDVLSLDDGSLFGWYCSIDNINIKVLNSSYKSGGMTGHLVLPISNKNNANSTIQYSCILSSAGEGGNLQFQFTIKPEKDLDFYAWWAHMNINNSSIIVSAGGEEGAAFAKADLSGFINLEGEIKGYKIDMKLIELQHLVLQTKKPYARLERAIASFDSPDHAIADFPVAIRNVVPYFSGSKAGLMFDLNITLSDISNKILPNATTTFKVYADVLGGDRPIWKRIGIDLTKVCIHGDLAGVVHIKEGCINFFKDDPVFGDGISGSLHATFLGFEGLSSLAGGGIECNVKFGNTSFNYWYFDASVSFPAVPIAPGLSINGFGGGAWYNLKPSANNENIKAKDYFQNMATYQVGAFVPSSGSVGFSAKVGICTWDDGFIFQGYGKVSMTFEHGIGPITAEVYAEMMRAQAGVTPSGNPPAQGIIRLLIDAANATISISGAMHIKYPWIGSPVVEGHGWFAFLADGNNQNYYLKIGEPEDGKRIEVSILDLATIHAYFMAGNHIESAIPDPDPNIINVALLDGYQKIRYNPDLGGLVMGASFKFSTNANYGIFYAGIHIGAGFDVNLARYTQGCDKRSSLPGMNGWYALGQVYANLGGELGAHVDLPLLPKGDYKLVSIDASILMRGGLPNPYWFEGWALIHFEALDGLIGDEVNFHFQIGDKCEPPINYFTKPLIKEVKPADQATNVPINAYTEVVFNYPVEKDIRLFDPASNKSTVFKVHIDEMKITNTDQNKVYASYTNDDSYPTFTTDHKKLILMPEEAFDGQTNYQIYLKVSAMKKLGSGEDEAGNATWVPLVQSGDKPVTSDTTTVFKTGYCEPDKMISDSHSRLGAFPFPGQRYFLQGESKKGAILLDRSYHCAADPDKDYKIFARLTPVRNHQELSATEVPVSDPNGHYMTFTIPSLPNDCIIRVDIIKKTHFSKWDKYQLYLGPATITHINQGLALQGGGNIQMNIVNFNSHTNPYFQQYINLSGVLLNQELNLGNKDVETILYSYHFKTSSYNTLTAKLGGAYFNKVKEYFLGMPTSAINVKERFDIYDVNGFSSGIYSQSGAMYFTMPLITLRETDHYNDWLRYQAVPLVYQKYHDFGINLNETRAHEGLSYTQLKYNGIECNYDGDVYCVPPRPIQVLDPDPPLTDAEIKAAEPVRFHGIDISGVKIIKIPQNNHIKGVILNHK